MIKAILRIALVLCVAGLSFPAYAGDPEAVHQQIEDLLGDADGFAEVFSQLQDAIQSGDHGAVSLLVDYPITIKNHGKTYTMETGGDFVDNFDKLISQPVSEVIANQDYGDLLVNSDGVMFGNGEVWMHRICEDETCTRDVGYWAIYAINN
jgi:hypothetical protein